MQMAINLQEFMDWYKKSEVILWDKKRVFREPKMCDTKLSVLEILEKYCIEWDWKEFQKIIEEEIPTSQQKEVISKILWELGLV